MDEKFSYTWYIRQLKDAKKIAEEFVLSIDEQLFLQPPEEGRWCIAECYSHLVSYGDLYYDNMAGAVSRTNITTDNLDRAFRPRWIFRKLAGFFEPPYKIKLGTVSSMRPDPVSGYSRSEVLQQYLDLQDRYIALLEKAQHRHIDLEKVKISHPLISWVKISLTECFALLEAHQRRHQWQAEQTLEALGG